VQDRDVSTADQLEVIHCLSMTLDLGDLQGHSPIASLSNAISVKLYRVGHKNRTVFES